MFGKNKLRVRNNELLLVFEPVIICAGGERISRKKKQIKFWVTLISDRKIVVKNKYM